MSNETNDFDPLANEAGWAALNNENSAFPDPTQPKKKSKLWLWITLAIVIPILICAFGFGALAIFGFNAAKAPIDATNNFYQAAKEKQDLDPYTCSKYLRTGSLNEDFAGKYKYNQQIVSYNFNSSSTVNGESTVTGTVERFGNKFYRAKVTLVREDGDYKVCKVRESAINNGR